MAEITDLAIYCQQFVTISEQKSGLLSDIMGSVSYRLNKAFGEAAEKITITRPVVSSDYKIGFDVVVYYDYGKVQDLEDQTVNVIKNDLGNMATAVERSDVSIIDNKIAVRAFVQIWGKHDR